MKAVCLALLMAGGAGATGAAATGKSAPSRSAAFELIPPRNAIKGQPIRLFVGIRNTGRDPLAFVVEPGSEEWIKSTSYQVQLTASEAAGEEDRGSGGGTQRGLSDALRPGQRWCPSGEDLLLLLPPGSRIFRMHRVTLGQDVVGTVLLDIRVRLLRADPSLRCGPAEFIEGTSRTRFVVRPQPPGP